MACLVGDSVLRTKLPDDAICLMALTVEELFDTEPDLFVAGMASGGHRVAVCRCRSADLVLPSVGCL